MTTTSSTQTAGGTTTEGPPISRNMSDFSWVFNMSSKLDQSLLSKFERNREIDDTIFYTFLVLYAVLICFGAAGNGLVVCAVVRKPSMRTARNMFIVNLAVSDMLLCVITMPLTLMEVFTKYWPLGEDSFICKMIGTLQATSIFVSTISITAIALDRYQVIVYPTGRNIQKLGAIVILVMIWLVSLLLASPLYLSRTVHSYNVVDTSFSFCLEDWPVQNGAVYYSLFSFLFQYVFPIVIVTVAYSRICKKLHYRYVNSSASKRNTSIPAPSTTGTAMATNPTAAEPPKTTRGKGNEVRRMKRTNSLLISIALIFGISWLPLNIYNIAVDTWKPFGEDRQAMLITYAVCHMIGMSSACSNPMLYGWLNENFRKEFKEICDLLCNVCCPFHWSPRAGGGGLGSARRRKLQEGGREGGRSMCREITNGPETVTSSLMHPDGETTSFTHVL